MPYNDEFRTQVLDTISNLQGTGQLFNRKRHTLEQVLNSYLTKMNEKHTMLGSVILERMQSHVLHIFKHVNSTTPYEVLDFAASVIKWYFQTLIKRRNKNTLVVEPVSLPDYTIPEIKELFEITLASNKE
jgi:hypothetical protein